MPHRDPKPLAPTEPMPPDVAARVTGFARACKAAVRAVGLYPSDHPAVTASLEVVTAAAKTAAQPTALHLDVLPDALTVDRRRLAHADAATAELAELLHRHQIGRLSVHPHTDADVWRRFLTLLALPPDEARLRGGLGKLWESEGEKRVGLRSVDYGELLRLRARGDAATWNAILAGCLEGLSFNVDEVLADLLSDVIQDPSKLGAIIEAVAARLPPGEGTGLGPLVVVGLLQAIERYVQDAAPEDGERVMTAVAGALTELPVDVLRPIVESPRAVARPARHHFMQQLLSRVTDSSVAALVTGEVKEGRGSSSGLADVVYDLAPDPDRRMGILDLVSSLLEQSGAGEDPHTIEAWRRTRESLMAHWDAQSIPQAYRQELGRVFQRAVELARDPTDPPDLLAAWRDTVDEHSVRLLDVSLLTELMAIRGDEASWLGLSALATDRVSLLVLVGDFEAAALLVEALRFEAGFHPTPAVRGIAARALEGIVTPATVQHVAAQLDTSDRSVVESARRFCLALGTEVVGPLAEVLSLEDRERRRQHLVEILVGFGPPGREIIERLCQSPNSAVRRTAVILLKECGGRDVLPGLVGLLKDSEAHVQREAARAIATLGLDAGDDELVMAIRRGPERSRAALFAGLSSLPPESSGRLLARVVLEVPRRGELWAVHAEAVGRLGSSRWRGAVDPLREVLEERRFWAPFRMAELQRRAIEALERIGSREALAVMEAVSLHGPRLVRAAARARLVAALEAAARGERTP